MDNQNTMKAALLRGPRDISLQSFPVPAPETGEALVRVEYCGVSGADLRSYRGEHPSTVYPIIPGAEAVGCVEAWGPGVDAPALGQRVLLEPVLTCGECAACRIGRYNCCAQLRFMSLHADGALAQRITVPANRLHALPDELPSPVAVLCEPFAIGLQAVERARVGCGDRVVVMGAGMIGLSVLLIARARGAHVLVAEVSEARRARAARLGAEAVSSDDLDQLRSAVEQFTTGEGASVVVDASGAPSMIAASTSLAASAARIAIIGWTAQPVQLSALDLVSKELDLLGVRNCTGLFPVAVQFVSDNLTAVEGLIDRVYPLSQVAEAYRFADAQGTRVLRVVIDMSS